jgi:ABC-type Fe3+-hydroxamate transport system substrate-binding protein
MKRIFFLLSLIAIVVLSGCGNNATQDNQSNQNDSQMPGMDHSEMKHSSSGELPSGLKKATNPKYKIGSQAILQTDHMEGMKGAAATIVGAYDTTVYVVSYTPTTEGERVKNHKWVIQEEIKNANKETLKAGTEVTLEADHMPGMKGTTATIESGEKMTVYIVDYTPTTGGEKVKNHKWVTESELTNK